MTGHLRRCTTFCDRRRLRGTTLYARILEKVTLAFMGVVLAEQVQALVAVGSGTPLRGAASPRARADAVRRLGLLLVLAVGCALGPDYKRPATHPLSGYPGGADTAGPTSLADQDWAQVFPDPALADLIHEPRLPSYYERTMTGSALGFA